MDPSPGSPPSTPAASSISSPSRSSTLNSFSTTQSQESDTTVYSQSSTSSDDTVSVPRSLTFPAMRSYPADHKSMPKGETIRMVDFPISSLYKHTALRIGVPVPLIQSSSGHNNTYLTRPDDQGVGDPIPNSQAPPSRHLTFPIGRPRNFPNFEDPPSFMPEGDEDRTVPELSRPRDSLAKDSDVAIPSKDMCYKVFKQEMPPEELEARSLQAQTDMFLESRLITSEERWMVSLLDSKQAGLQCQLPANPLSLSQRRKNSRRNSPLSNTRKRPERLVSFASQLYHAGREELYSPGGTMFDAASIITTSKPTAEPEDFSNNEPQTLAEDRKECQSPSPSARNRPYGESNRESSSQDSDDDSSFPHEGCSPSNEEDDDSTYNQLVESITNLVLESSCVGHVEERAVPVQHYVHNFLEQILNHPKPVAKPQISPLPIRDLPIGNNNAPSDAGDPGQRGRGQSGNGGSSNNGNKRKNKEAADHGRYHGNGDEDGLDDSSGEGCSNDTQEDKKRKTGRDDGKLSCPFRKRNPIRFNMRSHQSCALNGFADLALLKRHIKASHQKTSGSNSCVRCKETFPDQAALRHHQLQPESCSVRIPTGREDPEDGITEEVEQALKERARVRGVDSWESLWGLLFPEDQRIPKPYHEPPVELEELQEHFYKEDSVREFVQQQAPIPDQACGCRYIVDGLWHCRDKHSHERSKKRLEQDEGFVATVHNVLCTSQTAPQPQQTHSIVVSDPPQGFAPAQWGDDFNGSFSLGGFDFSASLSPYPIQPIYGTHVGINGSQGPAPTTLYPSSEQGSAHHPAPQHAPTTLPYGGAGMLPQNGSLFSTAGGSAHHSSGPSSQSLDSSYQTQETQDTQDTQYTQQSAAAFHQHHQPYPDDGRPCDHGGACSCSTSPVGIPGQVSSTHNLWGVGTKPVTRTAECLDGSNSDEDLTLGSIPDMS